MTIDTPDVGPRRGLLPGLPGPLRVVASASPSPARWSRGTPRRRTTASRAATCWASSSTCPTSQDLGRQRALPDADLPVGVEPSLPHVRLPDGRPAARRRRRAARAAGRGPRARHAGRARRRVQPHRSRLLAVPPRRSRTAPRRRTATGSTGSGRARRAATGAPYPSRRTSTRRPTSRRSSRPTTRTATNRCAAWATGRGGACPRCPSSTPTNPEVREHLLSRRRALAPLRDRRLAPRRARRDRGRGVLAGVPAPLPGDQPRRLHRRRDLARGAGVARRRPVRRGDELPARPRRSSGTSRRATSTSASCAPTTSTAARSTAATAPRSRLELERLMGLYDRAVTEVQLNLLGSHDSPRFRTMAGRRPRRVPPRGPAPGDAARRAVHLLRRRGRRDRRQRPGVPARHARGTRPRWDRDGLAWTRAAYGARHALPSLRRGTFRVVGRDGRCARVRACGGRRAGRGARRGQRRRRSRSRCPRSPRSSAARRSGTCRSRTPAARAASRSSRMAAWRCRSRPRTGRIMVRA